MSRVLGLPCVALLGPAHGREFMLTREAVEQYWAISFPVQSGAVAEYVFSGTVCHWSGALVYGPRGAKNGR